jgi:hypothetical protein
MQVAMMAAKIDRMPSPPISLRLSGAIAPNPPIIMPKLLKFAKPQRAYVMISFLWSLRSVFGPC